MTNVEMKRSQELQFSETERRASARLLSDFDPSSDGDADFDDNAPQKTLVIYSGPTSMNRVQDKNGMYIDNMNYFLEHGISCSDDTASNIQSEEDDNTESIIVNYAFVLTQEVADYYSAPNGPLTKKIQECKGVGKEDQVEEDGETTSTFIKVITRQDRCYDMESIRTVVTTMNVQALYDNLLFINCGLVGPKFGPGTPKLIPSTSSTSTNEPKQQTMVPYSHWSQIYTSRLTDSVRLVGHSINTHFHTFFPHVQSFLYAIKTETVPILLSSGAIYDCGLTQEELGGNDEKRFELINRYEVGMSTQLLKRGYKIATAFVNRYGFGKSLVYDKDSTWGTEIDDTVSDIWYEDGIRNLTASMSRHTPKWWNNEGKHGLRNPEEDTFEYHQWDILPWDHFLFFKVSRLVPEDVQNEMNYNANELEMSNVLVVSNDPRQSPSEYWLRKTGVFVEPRNDVFLAVACLGLAVLVLFMKKRRVLLMKGSLRPCNSRLGNLMLKRKLGYGHDHDT
mmetsp:Transcript_7679/g.16610  ORF Transcript_7679/g.16610 Transcript_7679/m.16610 type:complete len:507 (+) Transcript_7679:165-1685(+)